MNLIPPPYPMPTHLPERPTEVTTEPQRRVLDEMSRQLVQKLDAMIVEQNARVHAFTEKQHSLSALPYTQTSLPQQPQVSAIPPTPYSSSPTPPPLPDRLKTPSSEADDAPHKHEEYAEEDDEYHWEDVETPAPPPVRQRPVRRNVSDAPPLPFTRPAFTKNQPERKESNASSGLLTSLGFILLIILLRSCN